MLRLHRAVFKLPNPARFFSQTPITQSKALPPRLKINDADISISYLKGTGPGGQKINKTNSAVQIIHKPTGIVVKCQATRSQSQNAKTARLLLADRIEALQNGEKSRVAIKAEAARKKKASKLKKTKRKYRELEGKGKNEVEEEEDEVEIIWDDEVEIRETETGDKVESGKSDKSDKSEESGKSA